MSGPLPPLALLAATLLVLPDGTGDYPTIQAAVSAASEGDEILLGDGTFGGPGNHDITWNDKVLHVGSASGNRDACVVDCASSASQCNGRIGFVLDSSAVSGSTLSDLTISNAGCSLLGRGAITCKNGASPRLENLVVLDAGLNGIRCESGSSPELVNVEIRDGHIPAIHALGGSMPLLRGCVIEANSSPATAEFGVVRLTAGSPMLEECRIVGNAAQFDGVVVLGGPATLRRCLIAGNRGTAGGGIRLQGSATVAIERCTIVGNRASGGGGVYVPVGTTADVSHSILWGNCASNQGDDASVGGVLSAACSILDPAAIHGSGTVSLGADVIAADPWFCQVVDCLDAPVSGGAYLLNASSPARTHPCGPMGATGPGCGSTSTEAAVEAASWGAVKAR